MNKKYSPYILIAVLALALFVVKRCGIGSNNTTTQPTRKTTTTTTTGGVNRDRGFDRRVSYIEYTQHAKCRMQCRHITQDEVKQIMQDGKINYKKSDIQASPCPEYALEGVTGDNQRVRIVFAQCDTKTKVITCIDLDTEWTCDCPGDDKAHDNKRKN